MTTWLLDELDKINPLWLAVPFAAIAVVAMFLAPRLHARGERRKIDHIKKRW
jgi:hypothetical protein